MPPCAASSSPALALTAPVKDPRSWPNSSLSRRFSDSAQQFRQTSGAAALGESLVDRVRDDFLAHTRLAQDQHVDRATGDPLEGRNDSLESAQVHAWCLRRRHLDQSRLGRTLQRSSRRSIVRIDRNADGHRTSSVGQPLPDPGRHARGRRGRDVRQRDLEIVGTDRREQIDGAQRVREQLTRRHRGRGQGGVRVRSADDDARQSEGGRAPVRHQNLLVQTRLERRPAGEPEGGRAGGGGLDDEERVADPDGIAGADLDGHVWADAAIADERAVAAAEIHELKPGADAERRVMTRNARVVHSHVAQSITSDRELALRRQRALEGPRLAHDEEADGTAQGVHEDLFRLRLRPHG